MQLLEHFKELTLHPKNAEELKGLILQLAVQGKLTKKWREENPDVEPAKVLLEKIAIEKELLIKEKKIKKEKPLSSIKEAEIPDSLPNGWEWCKLGNSGYTQTGSTPPKNDSTNYGDFIPFLGPGDISNQWMKYPTEGLSEKGIKIGRLIPNGSLMMVCIGGSIGKCNINEMDVSCNQQINTVTPLIIPCDYIKTVCQASFFQKEVWEKSSGSATPIINKGKWENILIPIPPLEEQKAIVATVNQLFAEVEQLEALTKDRINLKADFVTSALNQLTQAAEWDLASRWAFIQEQFGIFFTEKATIKKLRETILQLAVQGKLTHHWRAAGRLSGVEVEPASELLEKIKAEKEQLIKAGKIKKEKPLPAITEEKISYDLPEGWVWCRLTDLTNIGTGSTPSKSIPDYYYGGNIPWYTSSATNDEFAKVQEVMITQKALDETNCKVFPSGSLIIAMYGQGKTRGQISEVITPGATNQALAVMVFYESSILTKQYLKYYFKKYYHEIRLLAEGGAQPNLNVGKIKETLIPLPTQEEMDAIVEKVNELMALCDQLEQEIENHQITQEQWMQRCLREVVEAKAHKELRWNMAAEPTNRYGNK